MEECFIKKRIHELTQKDHLDSKSNEQLFKQYNLDKQNNIPLEQSEARELLIVGNEKLVFRILIDKFGICDVSRDREEYSVGMMGLVKVVDTFDINKGCAFSTYAIQVISNEVRMYYRKNNKHDYSTNKITSINESIIVGPEGDVFSLEDYLGEEDDTVDCIIREQNLKQIKDCLQYLSDNERVSIIYGYGLFGNKKLTQDGIAEILGVNQAYVSRMMKYGRKKIRILSTPSSNLSPQDLETKYKLLNMNRPNDDFTDELIKDKQQD